MKKIIVLCTICWLAACAPVILKLPSQADADRASTKYPGITLTDLTQGKAFYEQHCNKCHSLKKAMGKSEEVLIKVVPKMAKKAKVDDKTKELILKYLLVMKDEK